MAQLIQPPATVSTTTPGKMADASFSALQSIILVPPTILILQAASVTLDFIGMARPHSAIETVLPSLMLPAILTAQPALASVATYGTLLP